MLILPLLLFLLILNLQACVLNSPTEADIQAEFDHALIGTQHCVTDSDCKILYPGCPLGCAASVNGEYVSQLSATATRLINDFNAGGQSCDYGCLDAYPVCVIDRCEAKSL